MTYDYRRPTNFYDQNPQDQSYQDYTSSSVIPVAANPLPMMMPSSMINGGMPNAQALGNFNGLNRSFDYNSGGTGGGGGGGALGSILGGLGGGRGPNGGGQDKGGWLGEGRMGDIGAGLAGLQTLGNLWMGFKQMKLANKSFKMNKMMAETNLANQMKAYNTNLGDRARSRGFTEGQNQDQIDRYVSDNRAVRVR